MDDSQLVRTVRMLLRSYRTKYYAQRERVEGGGRV